jgi:type IV pilus assembly protein PilN
MAHINLLPWREAQRKEKKQEFLTTMVFAALVTGILFFFIHTHMNGLVDHQKARNQFLENEIKILDQQIAEIRDLEETRKALLDRMNIIQELQVARPGIVHLFDQFVTTLPSGLYLTSVEQSGGALKIEGVAESNARVSAYMRNIEDSDWLRAPNLQVIEAADDDGRRVDEFSLNVQQTSPRSADADAEGGQS